MKSLLYKIFKLDTKLSFFEAVDKKNDERRKKRIKKFYSILDFQNLLFRLGVHKGDTIVVQCSFRKLMDFKVSPEQVCMALINQVGEKGNVLMPCYTSNPYFFNYFDKSEAGILSETFRNMKNVMRSLNSQFSMACFGADANYFCSEHDKSLFAFDCFSPYYKAVTERRAKILLIGDTVKTTKLSLLHLLSNDIDKDIQSKFILRENRLIDQFGNEIITSSYHRMTANNKKRFKMVTKKCSENAYESISLGHLTMVLFDSQRFIENAKKIKKCHLYK